MKHRIRWTLSALAAAALATGVVVSGQFEAEAEASIDQELQTEITHARNAVGASLERAHFEVEPPDEDAVAQGKEAWPTVYETLMSPRCMNCHPNGDKPLQTDESLPHAMNISRQSTENGLECATCHREENSEALGIEGGPPGAPHWQLPDKDMPLIFEGRSSRELCEQLKRPRDNGFKSLAQLNHHVAEDALVLWGWDPGGDRTVPPHSHEDFAAAFDLWVKSAGACP